MYLQYLLVCPLVRMIVNLAVLYMSLVNHAADIPYHAHDPYMKSNQIAW